MLLYFYAPDCSGCRMIEPHLPANAVKINADSQENWTLTCKYEITCLPTLIEVDDFGEVIVRLDRPIPRDLKRYTE